MDILSAPTRYGDALLFAAEVTEAATRTPHGEHGTEQLRDPYVRELLRHQGSWSWCDNRMDVDLAAGGALRATLDYVVRRQALSLPVAGTAPRELWPDVDTRVAALTEALLFAVTCAEDAWPHRLSPVLQPWIRQRLGTLLPLPSATEGLGRFAQRTREAVALTWRYRAVRHELFADYHWLGRPPAPWWCLDSDFALYSPFGNHGTHRTPSHALRRTPPILGAAEDTWELFTVTSTSGPAAVQLVTVANGAVQLPPDTAAGVHEAVAAGLTALGIIGLVNPTAEESSGS